MVFFQIVPFLLLLPFCSSQDFQTRPRDVAVNEKGTAIFQCVPVENGALVTVGWQVVINGIATTVNTGDNVTGIGSITVSDNRTNLTLANVSRSVNEAIITCLGFGTNVTSASSNITVRYPPEYTLVGSIPDPLTLGTSVTVQFTVDGNPPPVNHTIKGGRPVPPSQVTLSVNEVNITKLNLLCDDGGQYTIQSNNTAGEGSQTFQLNIAQARPSISDDVVINIGNEGTNVKFEEYVTGCPDNITITCEVPNMQDFTTVFDIGENTLVLLRRSQFVSDTESGEITISCIASNAVGDSAKRNVTVRYDELPTPTMLSSGAIAGIAIGCTLVFIIIVVLIIVGIGIFFCVKNKK